MDGLPKSSQLSAMNGVVVVVIIREVTANRPDITIKNKKKKKKKKAKTCTLIDVTQYQQTEMSCKRKQKRS